VTFTGCDALDPRTPAGSTFWGPNPDRQPGPVLNVGKPPCDLVGANDVSAGLNPDTAPPPSPLRQRAREPEGQP